MVRVGIGRHGNLEYNVEVLACIMAIDDVAIIEAAGLDFDGVLVSSRLFFKK